MDVIESNGVCDCWASGNNGGNRILLDGTDAAAVAAAAVSIGLESPPHDSRMFPSIIPGISPSSSWTSQRDSYCCSKASSLLLLLADAVAHVEWVVAREAQDVERTLMERVLEKYT